MHNVIVLLVSKNKSWALDNTSVKEDPTTCMHNVKKRQWWCTKIAVFVRLEQLFLFLSTVLQYFYSLLIDEATYNHFDVGQSGNLINKQINISSITVICLLLPSNSVSNYRRDAICSGEKGEKNRSKVGKLYLSRFFLELKII